VGKTGAAKKNALRGQKLPKENKDRSQWESRRDRGGGSELQKYLDDKMEGESSSRWPPRLTIEKISPLAERERV